MLGPKQSKAEIEIFLKQQLFGSVPCNLYNCHSKGITAKSVERSYLVNATEDTEFFLNRPDEPRLYMASLVLHRRRSPFGCRCRPIL